ncbi:hypothetical protein [Dokdonella sp.]|uniref:hypothetical protein n=1 Tax=Dokdonella sp. TaxID=2291710 RepID=UPI003C5A4717
MQFGAVADSAETRAFLDTGWPRGSANDALLETLAIAVDDPQIRVEPTVLRSGAERTARPLEPGPIQIGKNLISGRAIEIGDDAISCAGRKLGPFPHMSSDLLADYRLLVDPAKGQVVRLPGQPAP